MLCFKFFRIFVESNINVLPTGMVQSKDSENSKVELRRRITVSALEAFKEKGIKAVRMDDIAKRLNISKRTLYEVFEDNLKSASNLNGNLNCSKELEHYAS